MRFGVSQSLFALVALTASAASAAAQEAPAPAAPAPAAAPATDSAANDANVSQIHGQLVPVGDHNQYTYDFKRWNVSTNPIGLIVGSYGASLSYGVSQNIALRGDVNYFAPVDSDVKGFELGVGAPIYLRRTYQGAFVEPGLIVRQFDIEANAETGTAAESATTFGPQVLLGWHWSWDSGLNIAVALGMGRNFSSSDSTNEEVDQKLFANGYLRIGYEF
jgi:hypothetical protein